MTEMIEDVLHFVCEQCNVTKDEILSRNRHVPIPLARGFFWYILKRSTGYSCRNIAELCSSKDTPFTPAGVGSAINRTSYAISRDRLWANRWDMAIKQFNLSNIISKNNTIELTISVPFGMKDKVNINIKENKLT